MSQAVATISATKPVFLIDEKHLGARAPTQHRSRPLVRPQRVLGDDMTQPDSVTATDLTTAVIARMHESYRALGLELHLPPGPLTVRTLERCGEQVGVEPSEWMT